MSNFYVNDGEIIEETDSILKPVKRLQKDCYDIAKNLDEPNDVVIDLRYMEKLYRVRSELFSFLVLEDVVRVTFSYLNDMPAEEFFKIQKNINEIIGEYAETAATLREVVVTWSVDDSRLINIQRDIKELADDLLDSIERRKDKLNEFMSEIGEQFK